MAKVLRKKPFCIIWILLITSMILILPSCEEESITPEEEVIEEPTEVENQELLSEVENSGDVLENPKEEEQSFASITSYNGTKIGSVNLSLSKNQWRALRVSRNHMNGYGELAVIIKPSSGDPDIYLYTDRGRFIKSSTQGGLAHELIVFTPSMLQSNENGFYIYLYGYSSTQFTLELYGKTQSNSNNTPSNFPATVLTSKNSTSKYATTHNVFNDGENYAGQCTWYCYGRIMELADQGHLSQSTKNWIYNKLCCTTGRHAKNWPAKLGVSGISTNHSVLPMNKRNKGMLVVWRNSTDPYGHIGFVEEISSDKKRYKVSDFNRLGQETYRTQWFDFEGNDRISLGVGTSDYPIFIEL